MLYYIVGSNIDYFYISPYRLPWSIIYLGLMRLVLLVILKLIRFNDLNEDDQKI